MGEESKKLTSFHYSCAGALSGVISRFLAQPLDVIKIRQQLQNKHKQTLQYRSIYSSFRFILKKEGIFGLWKGHVPAQVLSILYGSAQFACYEKSKLTLNGYFPNARALNDFLSGGNAGLLASFVVHPFDLLRTRKISLTVDSKISLVKLVRLTAMENGWKTFYQGVIPNMFFVYPYCGLNFLFYGILKRAWKKHKLPETKAKALANGMISGFLAKAILLPLDNSKKRLQVQGSVGYQSQYTGMVDCILTIAKESGIKTLYRGVLASAFKTGLATGVSFLVYEETCELFRYQ